MSVETTMAEMNVAALEKELAVVQEKLANALSDNAQYCRLVEQNNDKIKILSSQKSALEQKNIAHERENKRLQEVNISLSDQYQFKCNELKKTLDDLKSALMVAEDSKKDLKAIIALINKHFL